MDSKTALEKIKEAEIKAQDSLEQAKRKSRQILQEASTEKARILKQAQDQANHDAQNLQIKIEKETVEEIAAIDNQTSEAIKILRKGAQVNLNKAADFIKTKIDL